MFKGVSEINIISLCLGVAKAWIGLFTIQYKFSSHTKSNNVITISKKADKGIVKSGRTHRPLPDTLLVEAVTLQK